MTGDSSCNCNLHVRVEPSTACALMCTGQFFSSVWMGEMVVCSAASWRFRPVVQMTAAGSPILTIVAASGHPMLYTRSNVQISEGGDVRDGTNVGF